MSHELRTPLNHVIGFTELVLDDAGPGLSPIHRESLADALGSARRLLSLINDVLDTARVESGKLELEPGEVALAELFEQSLGVIGEKSHRAGIEISSEIADIPATAWVDERRLKQVLDNILSNAVKFSPRGGAIVLRRPARRGPGRVPGSERFRWRRRDTPRGHREVVRPLPACRRQQHGAGNGPRPFPGADIRRASRRKNLGGERGRGQRGNLPLQDPRERPHSRGVIDGHVEAIKHRILATISRWFLSSSFHRRSPTRALRPGRGPCSVPRCSSHRGLPAMPPGRRTPWWQTPGTPSCHVARPHRTPENGVSASAASSNVSRKTSYTDTGTEIDEGLLGDAGRVLEMLHRFLARICFLPGEGLRAFHEGEVHGHFYLQDVHPVALRENSSMYALTWCGFTRANPALRVSAASS